MFQGKVWYGPKDKALVSEPFDTIGQARAWINRQPQKKRGYRRSMILKDGFFYEVIESQ